MFPLQAKIIQSLEINLLQWLVNFYQLQVDKWLSIFACLPRQHNFLFANWQLCIFALPWMKWRGFHCHLIWHLALQRGGVGIFGFGQFLARLFQFLHLKTAVFWFWCLLQFAGFLQFSLWFLSTIMAVFQIFLSNAFYGFSGGSYSLQSRRNCNSKGLLV